MDVLKDFIEIHKIFKINNWNHKDSLDLVFDSFCNLFTLLDQDERKLILELTKNYQWITQAEYQDKFIEAMESIEEAELKDVVKIYFFPILKLEDVHKIKSGEHLLYMIKSYKQLMRKYLNVRFELLGSFEQVLTLKLGENERLYLVDDYIGSGQTFNYCMYELAKNAHLKSNLLKVVCIAIQQDSLIDLNMNGYAVLKSLVIKKGITDYNFSPFVEEKKELMRNIERHVPGSKTFSLGYEQTEALITMMRTPDNTFPVFWKKFRKDGELLDAPFARYEEYE